MTYDFNDGHGSLVLSSQTNYSNDIRFSMVRSPHINGLVEESNTTHKLSSGYEYYSSNPNALRRMVFSEKLEVRSIYLLVRSDDVIYWNNRHMRDAPAMNEDRVGTGWLLAFA